jgi:hypothetical protein
MGIPTFAFVGQGKLMICRPGREPEPIESAFVQRIEDRVERERERHGWRGDGMMWNMMSPMAMRGGMAPSGAQVRSARFVSVANGLGGMMLYSISTSQVGGLFEFDPAKKEERRLVHKAGFNAEALTAHPASGELAFCIRNTDGTAAIGVAQADGSKHRSVTEGDSLDECPSWVPGTGRNLVFQSAGIARDQAGHPRDHSSYRNERLDLDAQKMDVIVEDVRFDYLAPRIDAKGNLLAIRRPYESRVPHVSPFGLLKDIVLFPFRVLMTIAAFLNFLSMFVRQQPLYRAGGPSAQDDSRPMVLFGRYIDTRKALAASNKEQALVKPDWKLIRRTPDGTETVLAERVVHFDLADDGVVWTNGSRVYLIDSLGSQTELVKGKLIEHLAVIRDRSALPLTSA